MTSELTTADIPQEDNLGKVLLVLRAIAQGLQDTRSIAEQSKVSQRHVGYGINAAFVLGLAAEGDEALVITPAGAKLLAQPAGSAEERALLRAAMEASPVLRELAPDLLAEAEPARAALAQRIHEVSGLSQSTSERRARTLLSWRRQALGGAP